MYERENVLKKKSFDFALRTVKLHRYLCEEQKGFIMSKQLLRSGTSPGAMIREAEFAESKSDFIYKMAVAQKETNEAMYWLELLYAAEYLLKQQFESIYADAIEIMKLVTSSIKTAKVNN
jgi:four helix bundle protein